MRICKYYHPGLGGLCTNSTTFHHYCCHDGLGDGLCMDFEKEQDELVDIKSGDVRTFASGATRDSSDGKFDYEGFISPLCLEAYGEYMHSHRTQSDGHLRDSDNWTKGMGLSTYMKSMLRHVIDLWFMHRGYERKDIRTGKVLTVKEVCSAIVFNTLGYLFETITKKEQK